ncbi:MAG: hypothetical protein ACLTW9_03435 [Enterocloster sp.]
MGKNAAAGKCSPGGGETRRGRVRNGRRRNGDSTVSRFIRYAECASESHNEKAFCEYMEQELAGMGIPFERQSWAVRWWTDGWNILARIPGRSGKNPFLFVFHLDTAAPSNHEVQWKAGIRVKAAYWGLDGKLAIAVVMEARAALCRREK